jgi:peptidyl-prolyl cis-trans isomerase C
MTFSVLSRPVLARMARGFAVSSLALGIAFVAPVAAQDVAKVNGKVITEADIKLAESEIGPDLGSLPEGTKRRVLLEYIIETQLMAEAAEKDKLGSGAAYDQRLTYWRRRALRDLYFDTAVKGSVKDADAKAFYDQQVKAAKPEEEVKARHILVETEAQIKDVITKLNGGADFEKLAKEVSKDPGSKETGGDLGFFSRGQMVPQFEEAAFKLDKGKISEPIQTQFGWHVIKVDDKRTRPLPTFEQVKERLVASMIHQKAQATGLELRQKAEVEFLDAEIKKAVEAEKAAGAPKKQ